MQTNPAEASSAATQAYRQTAVTRRAPAPSSPLFSLLIEIQDKVVANLQGVDAWNFGTTCTQARRLKGVRSKTFEYLMPGLSGTCDTLNFLLSHTSELHLMTHLRSPRCDLARRAYWGFFGAQPDLPQVESLAMTGLYRGDNDDGEIVYDHQFEARRDSRDSLAQTVMACPNLRAIEYHLTGLTDSDEVVFANLPEGLQSIKIFQDWIDFDPNLNLDEHTLPFPAGLQNLELNLRGNVSLRSVFAPLPCGLRSLSLVVDDHRDARHWTWLKAQPLAYDGFALTVRGPRRLAGPEVASFAHCNALLAALPSCLTTLTIDAEMLLPLYTPARQDVTGPYTAMFVSTTFSLRQTLQRLRHLTTLHCEFVTTVDQHTALRLMAISFPHIKFAIEAHWPPLQLEATQALRFRTYPASPAAQNTIAGPWPHNVSVQTFLMPAATLSRSWPRTA